MGTPTIDLLLVGVSHRTAPVAVRERLAVEPEAIEGALAELGGLPAVREAAMVSTCNRVELYVAAVDADAAARGLAEVLARRAGVAHPELRAHLYEHRDARAVHHLFRVASSLDSLVIGEPQILGQIKQAHETALRHGTAGALLNDCFTGAFRVARRVRRDTAIARNPVSVSSVAVDLARSVVGDFKGRRVLVVGAGKMSELAARTLRTQGATLTVTNRTRARAEELATRYGAAVADWNDLAAALTAADIVIASTGAQRPVLTLELLTRVQRARRGRPLSLLDIAVPRDVEPAAGKLDGIYLADIDDLQKVAGDHQAERKGEAAEAEAIVEQELRALPEGLARPAGRAHGDGVPGARPRHRRGRGAAPLRLADRSRRARQAGDPEIRGEHRQEAAAPAADGAAPERRRGGGSAGRGGAAPVRPRGGGDGGDRGGGGDRDRRGGGGRVGGRRGRGRGGCRRRRGGRRRRGPDVTAGAIVIGTRGSALARWQAAEIGRLLGAAHPGLEVREEIIVTAGDRTQTGPVIDLGGKGVWVEEIEAALSARRIDLAVHSMKDVPAELAPGLAIVAIPARADPRDAIVSRTGATLAALPAGSRVGTSSLRRVCQVRAARPDVATELLRGNVDTRLRKVAEGVVDAAVLASAGLDRLGFPARIAERLDVERMLPAIGQGALALEARADDARVVALCRALADPVAEVTVAAERALLARLGVGCRTPVAGHATLADGRLTVAGLVGRPDASEMIRETVSGPAHRGGRAGRRARRAPARPRRRPDPPRPRGLSASPPGGWPRRPPRARRGPKCAGLGLTKTAACATLGLA